MSRIMPSLGLSNRVNWAEARLSRRGAYPHRYLVQSHAQDELAIAPAMSDRQKRPHAVGAHLTTFRLICSTTSSGKACSECLPDAWGQATKRFCHWLA